MASARHAGDKPRDRRRSGGGQVFFPAGVYESFSIHLKSHVELHFSQGSTLLAADSPLPGQTTGEMGGTYDIAEPDTPYDSFQDYGHNHWHNSLIWGEGLDGVSITGPGLIWGKGLSHGREHEKLGYLFVPEQHGSATRPSHSRIVAMSFHETSPS